MKTVQAGPRKPGQVDQRRLAADAADAAGSRAAMAAVVVAVVAAPMPGAPVTAVSPLAAATGVRTRTVPGFNVVVAAGAALAAAVEAEVGAMHARCCGRRIRRRWNSSRCEYDSDSTTVHAPKCPGRTS